MRRTRRALVQALVGLVLEKRYDAITIQDILDRADVGRSTFYSHFRGKDDLLLRSFEQMLEGLDQHLEHDGPRPRVAPVRELLRHVDGGRAFTRALARSRMLERTLQAGADRLTGSIAARLEELPSSPEAERIPPDIAAPVLAGGLFSLVRWWLDADAPPSPERMDELFHAMFGFG